MQILWKRARRSTFFAKIIQAYMLNAILKCCKRQTGLAFTNCIFEVGSEILLLDIQAISSRFQIFIQINSLLHA